MAMKVFGPVIVLVAMFLVGCAGVEVKPPVGCEQSVLYSKLQYPSQALSILAVGVYEGVKAKPESKEYVIEALDTIDDCLGDGQLTYSDLAFTASHACGKVWREYAVDMQLLASMFEGIGPKVKVNDCDRKLLMDYIKKQRAYLRGIK